MVQRKRVGKHNREVKRQKRKTKKILKRLGIAL